MVGSPKFSTALACPQKALNKGFLVDKCLWVCTHISYPQWQMPCAPTAVCGSGVLGYQVIIDV